MNDQRAGHALERQSVSESGDITTTSELTFRLQRLGSEISISIANEFVESPDGKPRSMQSSQNLGLSTVRERYRFTDSAVLQETLSSGRTTRRKNPLPEGHWLTPAKARDYAERRIAEHAEEFTYSVLDPSAGLTPVQQTHRVRGERPVEVFGKSVPAVEWVVTQSAMPGVQTTEFVDKKGVLLRTEINLGGITMVMLEADKELALSNFSAPELMASTLVHPDKPIDNPRDARRAEFLLSRSDAGDMPDLPSDAAQTATRIDRQTIRVVVNLDNAPLAPAQDALDHRYTDPSTTADSADPALIELTNRALTDIPDDPRAKADALRAFVHAFINQKSLGVGFATASEVCATREGDCSEHGVLLAALLRAAHIPSRAVSGLVFVDSFLNHEKIFGFHMWTQALIPVNGLPRWIDVDATLPGANAFDATHIALSTSSLAEGDVANSIAALVGLLGNLKIQVVRVEP